MCYWEENICKQIEIPYLLTVLLSISLYKLPWSAGGSLDMLYQLPLKHSMAKFLYSFTRTVVAFEHEKENVAPDSTWDVSAL